MPDFGSLIQKQQQKKSVKKNLFSYFFKNIFLAGEENILGQFT
jgi:hypothetical protein